MTLTADTRSTMNAAEYLRAFQGRRECCRALWDLTQRQPTLIADNNYAELIELLHHMQQLLDELLEPDEPHSLWRRWREDRKEIDLAQRRACETVLDETDALLQQILHSETASTSQLTDRRDVVAEELRSLSEAGQLRQLYQSAPVSELPAQLDLDL